MHCVICAVRGISILRNEQPERYTTTFAGKILNCSSKNKCFKKNTSRSSNNQNKNLTATFTFKINPIL